jgi:hypothetical protein
MLAWLSANWSQLLVAILAIDAALIPLFPSAGLLVTIKNVLSSLGPKPPAAS